MRAINEQRIIDLVRTRSRIKATDLRKCLRLSAPVIAQYLKRLDKQGTIMIVPDEIDRRIRWVMMTSQGSLQETVKHRLLEMMLGIPFEVGFMGDALEPLQRLSDSIVKLSASGQLAEVWHVYDTIMYACREAALSGEVLTKQDVKAIFDASNLARQR